MFSLRIRYQQEQKEAQYIQRVYAYCCHNIVIIERGNSRMDYGQKIQTFRKEIRKDHINSLFSQKRIRMLSALHHDQTPMEPEKEITSILDPGQMSVEELRRIAVMAQTQSGILVIQKASYESYIEKYLGEKYTGTDEQRYASYILCNLYYMSSTEPSESLTREVIRLLSQATMPVLENIMFLIGNAIIDFPGWLEELLISHHLGQKLPMLFQRFPAASSEYLTQLLSLVYKVMKKKGKYSCFYKLRQPIMRLLLQAESEETRDLIKKAAYCLNLLATLFPQEMAPLVVKSGALQRLIYLWDYLNDGPLVRISLQLMDLALHQITVPEMLSLVIPYLTILTERGFSLGEQPGNFSSSQLKLLTFKLVTKALQSGKLDTEYFCSLKLAQMMMEELSMSEDKNVLQVLSTAFAQVYLNSDQEVTRREILPLIERAGSICQSYSLAVMVHELKNQNELI